MNYRNTYLSVESPEARSRWILDGVKAILPIFTPLFSHVQLFDGLTTLSFYCTLLHHKFLHLANDPTGNLIVYRNILINWSSPG